MSYIKGDFTKPEIYGRIRDALGEAEKAHGTKGNAIFYLAVADRFFGPVVDQLGKAEARPSRASGRIGKPAFWRRVVIEKPFGHSVQSARDLNADILRTLSEDQIFRIDHFLGKDTVQSIMAFRFANGLFEPIWNRDRIDHVQITASETVGVETARRILRGDRRAARHGPQPCLHLAVDGGHGAAERLRRRSDPHQEGRCVRRDAVGQAGRRRCAASTAPAPCWAMRSKAYRDEPKVAPDSNTETYVAMELEIDNWRWAGVPFFIRTGKHMAARMTEIAIRFKQAPYAAFEDTPVNSLRSQLAGAAHRPGRGDFAAVRGQAARAR